MKFGLTCRVTVSGIRTALESSTSPRRVRELKLIHVGAKEGTMVHLVITMSNGRVHDLGEMTIKDACKRVASVYGGTDWQINHVASIQMLSNAEYRKMGNSNGEQS